VTVTAEQWQAVAADLGVSVSELQTKIINLDRRHRVRYPEPRLQQVYFDRHGEPLTLGQWAFLYEAPSYKFLRNTILPNRYWIATIWQGVNPELDEPPMVLETGVMLLNHEDRGLDLVYREVHPFEEAAFVAHDAVVRMAARRHLY
jgi:hypothetical protein